MTGMAGSAQIEETDRRAVQFDIALVQKDFYVAREVSGGRVAE